ncbi:uncharacterized protein LOC122366254 [Amphibalanus amphitrite]|uniref:uncharacterized protein LOC122366254 n=1 Tax=Amphibalanus amphitrite TaxID=1232801 RepID=UPI001C90ED9F|nr:uncharacterized protein LOC122366254 [Amphibalanus amphitrite]XP_043194197.1 uncharacterized protein LOC122366254 [Amphibalanus amphitrite]XP_043194198.1 uncharacterized protein LOC122366254 [Amphibalanus amphitrite]
MSSFYEVSVPAGGGAPYVWSEPTNTSCPGGECALLEELGPPPDMILTLPPPPLPSFLAESAPQLMNHSCGLCRWASGGAVDYVEMPRQGPAIDDTWFFVIICACVGLTLFGILLTIFCLRLKEQKKSRLGLDSVDTNKPPLGSGQCEAVLYPPPSTASSAACRSSRALWAGLRTRENHYTIEHVQPVEQKSASITASSFEFPDDYSSVGYTSISPQAYRAGIPDGVHLLPAHDNTAYAASDEAMQVTRVAPDGCVVTASPRARPQRTESYQLRRRSDDPPAEPEYEEHCYEEPLAGRPLAPDERYQTPAGVDLTLHIYEKPQFRSVGRSPKNRPKLLNSLSRNSPRPRRAAPSISSPRSLEFHQLPPLNGRQHRRTEDGRLLKYTPPQARLNVSYPSPVV